MEKQKKAMEKAAEEHGYTIEKMKNKIEALMMEVVSPGRGFIQALESIEEEESYEAPDYIMEKAETLDKKLNAPVLKRIAEDYEKYMNEYRDEQ